MLYTHTCVYILYKKYILYIISKGVNKVIKSFEVESFSTDDFEKKIRFLLMNYYVFQWSKHR